MGCHFLLQGIFPTQDLNLGLMHCRWIIYHLSHQGQSVMNSIMTLFPALHSDLENQSHNHVTEKCQTRSHWRDRQVGFGAPQKVLPREHCHYLTFLTAWGKAQFRMLLLFDLTQDTCWRKRTLSPGHLSGKKKNQ